MEGYTARGVKMTNYWQLRDVTMYQLMCGCGAMSEEGEGQKEAVEVAGADGWWVRYISWCKEDYIEIVACLCPKCWKGESND